VRDVNHIKRLNKVDRMSWKAGHNEFFNGMTFDDARIVLGTALNPEQVHPFLQDSPSNASLPTDFDAKTQWPGLIHPIRNQMRCGSCWAFSASEVLSDQCSIASKSKSPVLSVKDMVSCDKKMTWVAMAVSCQSLGLLDKHWNRHRFMLPLWSRRWHSPRLPK